MLAFICRGLMRFAVATSLVVTHASGAAAHGLAGERFFPATILTDDPYVADEVSLPTVTVSPPAPDGSQQILVSPSIAKRITPDIGVVLTHQWERLQPPGQPAVSGLGGTLSTMLQYQLFINAPHQAIGLIGVNSEWGHTGRVQALGAPDFTTVSPLVNFGKGFGDLPDTLHWLRPIAITGSLSFGFPTKTQSAGIPNPNLFNYGFAFEYSLPYLECCVKDIGLRRPFSQLFPLVEVSFSTSLNRGLGGQTTGTIQPGIIWAGTYFQVGAEAILPATRLTGHGYGGVVQLHFYLDDLFPRSIGKPISEWW